MKLGIQKNYFITTPAHVERLIYKKTSNFHATQIDEFIMFSLKKEDKGKFARMICFPDLIERDGKKNVRSLYVWKLFGSGHGFGTDMLNFAKIYSKQLGCNGYLHLEANGGYTPNRVPQIFYRKFGMGTKFKFYNDILDSFIRRGKNATWRDCDNVDMYYPPIKFKKNKSLWEKFIYFFVGEN